MILLEHLCVGKAVQQHGPYLFLQVILYLLCIIYQNEGSSVEHGYRLRESGQIYVQSNTLYKVGFRIVL